MNIASPRHFVVAVTLKLLVIVCRLSTAFRMLCILYCLWFAGRVVNQQGKRAAMIPPDHPRPPCSSSRPELREQHSSCTCPALQPADRCCCCRQELSDHLHRLVSVRTGVTAAHRRRRRGTVSTHIRRHSVGEPALPGQVFCYVIQMTLNDLE